MRLTASDVLMAQFCRRAHRLLRIAGNLESSLLPARYAPMEIDRPVFVTGLARAGSTMLLEFLARVPGVATHRYRDFPFVAVPMLWNAFRDRLSVSAAAVERPHQDGIRITPESPESMDEPIWISFFPHLHVPGRCHLLDTATQCPAFEEFFTDHIRKLLRIRDGRRYVSKNNALVTRIHYVSRLLPDARFVIPIRHPFTHVASLVRQHRLFCDYTASDPRVASYLAASGHFEFGPQRVPVAVDVESAGRTAAAWSRGEELREYSIQWAQVYGLIRSTVTKMSSGGLSLHIVSYEDLCQEPATVLQRLMDAVELPGDAGAMLADFPPIVESGQGGIEGDPDRELVWAETGDVAQFFGYAP